MKKKTKKLSTKNVDCLIKAQEIVGKEMNETGMQIACQDFVKKLFDDCLNYLLLDFVKVSFNWVDRPAPGQNGGQVTMKAVSSPSYHRLDINIYPPIMDMYKDKEYDEIFDIVVHELSHIHTEKMRSLASERFTTPLELNNENEHLTELIAEYIRLIIRADSKGPYKDIKK